MLPFLLVAPQANKIFQKALICFICNDWIGHFEQMQNYHIFLNACGYNDQLFDSELLKWIDSQWDVADNVAYYYHERHFQNRFLHWN